MVETETDSRNWLLSFHDKPVFKAKTFAVTGAKGGVGKTSISLKLARELSKNHKVLLIDCDFNLSNTPIKLGIPLSDNFMNLLNATKTFEECLYKEENFHLLTGCNGNLQLLYKNLEIEKIIFDIMITHERSYDFIILDCPAGVSLSYLSLNAFCSHRLLVVTPEKESITDAYSLIKLLNMKFNIKENHLIVNKFTKSDEYKKVIKTLSETAEFFLGCRTHIVGGIPKINDMNYFSQKINNKKITALDKNFLKVLENVTEEMCD